MKNDLIYAIKWLYDAGVYNFSTEDTVDCLKSIDSISTLQELREAISNVECELQSTATNMVFGDGNPEADIMFIGEAPGADEDAKGLPFVGQSGQLLTKAIEALGVKRSDVYITNIIPWRPLGNRTPTNNEIELFRPYLIRHIQIVNPRVIVCLGSSASKAVLQTNDGISKLRGRWISGVETIGLNIEVIATFHPAYLLRSPSQKKEFWRDLLRVADRIVDQ